LNRSHGIDAFCDRRSSHFRQTRVTTPPTASLDLWSAGTLTGAVLRRRWQGLPGSGRDPSGRMPCSLTPAEPSRQALCGARVLSPFRYTRTTPAKVSLSRLDHTASAPAVYASQAPLRCHPRKTRFRLAANLCRAGLITRQVPFRKVSDSADFRLQRLPPSPGFRWRTRRRSSAATPGRMPWCRSLQRGVRRLAASVRMTWPQGDGPSPSNPAAATPNRCASDNAIRATPVVSWSSLSVGDPAQIAPHVRASSRGYTNLVWAILKT